MSRRKLLFGLGLFVSAVITIHPAVAQTTFSIESVGGQLGLGGADLRETTLNALRWALGILTVVAVAFLIIGFGNLLISGDSDAVRVRARRIITGALIGLIVVLLAWAIVIFVTRTTANVTV